MEVYFENEVRKVWHKQDEEWYFSVVDVCAVLTEQENVRNASTYWAVLKKRLKEEGANELLTNCKQLKMIASDGKMRKTDSANIEQIFRIIQSIPSKKAEPFKQWLALVGKERLDEIAGNARKELEAKLGRTVISSSNASTPELLDDTKKK